VPRASVHVEDVIARLCEQPGRVLTARDVSELGPAGDLLRQWGAVRRGDNLTAVSCTSCGEDHPVELEYDAKLRAWLYYCSSVGWVVVDESDLVTFRFVPGWLFDRLTEALQIGRPDQRCLIDKVLWQLGTARTGTAFWTAFIARNVEAHLNAILGALQLAGAAFPGLVLTSSLAVPHRVPLPNGHRWVPLTDLLEVSGGQLWVREPVIRAALRGKGVRQLVPRPRGPAGVDDLILEQLARRQQANETCPKIGDKAAALQEWLRIAHPERGPRSRGRIENIIREPHAKWRSRNPQATR
jgi:hypothetical protein